MFETFPNPQILVKMRCYMSGKNTWKENLDIGMELSIFKEIEILHQSALIRIYEALLNLLCFAGFEALCKVHGNFHLEGFLSH